MKDRVCSEEEYRKVMGAVNSFPPQVEHLILQTGTLFWSYVLQGLLFLFLQAFRLPTHAWCSWRLH